MKVITFQNIVSLGISPARCYEWVTDMLKNKNKALLPPKISMKLSEGYLFNIMPSILPKLQASDKIQWGGVKAITRYPDRIPSIKSSILLLNANTGEFTALMDGTWITAMRTGAVAAHSIILLGRKNFSTIGMMGLGNSVRATLLVLLDMMPHREFNIKLLKYKGQEEDFAARFSHFKNLHFTFVDTAEEMIKKSDVVVSGATYLTDDICTDEYFGEGILVVPIHTRGFTNCDLFFDKVFADDRGHVDNFKYFNKFRKFAEVCDVVNGIKPGRESDTERILAYNIGLFIHDINFAAHIYQMMEAEGFLRSLPEAAMEYPTTKFWI